MPLNLYKGLQFQALFCLCYSPINLSVQLLYANQLFGLCLRNLSTSIFASKQGRMKLKRMQATESTEADNFSHKKRTHQQVLHLKTAIFCYCIFFKEMLKVQITKIKFQVTWRNVVHSFIYYCLFFPHSCHIRAKMSLKHRWASLNITAVTEDKYGQNKINHVLSLHLTQIAEKPQQQYKKKQVRTDRQLSL